MENMVIRRKAVAVEGRKGGEGGGGQHGVGDERDQNLKVVHRHISNTPTYFSHCEQHFHKYISSLIKYFLF
jgi:hypothetical protein